MTPNRLTAIAFRWSISAVFALRVFAPNAQAQSAATAINGVYNGSYTCAQGPRTLRLSLLASGNGSLTGVFTFYLPPTSHTQAFSYSLNGTFDAASRKFKLNPVKWEVSPPGSYSMVGMDGAFDPGTGRVAGKITYGSCGTFQATRDKAEAPNLAIVAPHKTAESAPPPRAVAPAAPAQPPPAKSAAPAVPAPHTPTSLAAPPSNATTATSQTTATRGIVRKSKVSWGEPACQLIPKSSLESILGFQYGNPKIMPVVEGRARFGPLVIVASSSCEYITADGDKSGVTLTVWYTKNLDSESAKDHFFHYLEGNYSGRHDLTGPGFPYPAVFSSVDGGTYFFKGGADGLTILMVESHVPKDMTNGEEVHVDRAKKIALEILGLPQPPQSLSASAAAPESQTSLSAHMGNTPAIGNTESNTGRGSVGLSVCNAGKVAIDVFISQSGKVSSSHIGAADCASVAESTGSMGPAYVGLAFVDARGQWGAARRQDLLPDFGLGVLTRANQSVPVRHGNTTVSLPMQLLFQPRGPKCTTYRSATDSLSPFATNAERDTARRLDAMGPPSGTVCETRNYSFNVVAYPDSREITFNNFCEPCDKKAEARLTPEERAARQQRSAAVNQEVRNLETTGPLGALVMGNVVNLGKQAAQEEEREREQERRQQQPESYRHMDWNEMNHALAYVHGSGGRPPEMPQYLIIRGTVSRVDLSPPGASEHWVNVYFRESSEQASTSYETSYGAFNVCTSNADIFVDMFGPDFRSRMIGKVLEVEGEYQLNYCKGWKGSIRVTLARQVHVVGAAR